MLANILGLSHSAVGIGTLLGPSYVADFFGMTITPSAEFLGRLFGCRDLLLGAGLFWAYETDRPKDEKVLLLTIINAMNAIDVCSGLVCYAQGTIGEKCLFWGSGGASLLCGLGVAALRAL